MINFKTTENCMQRPLYSCCMNTIPNKFNSKKLKTKMDDIKIIKRWNIELYILLRTTRIRQFWTVKRNSTRIKFTEHLQSSFFSAFYFSRIHVLVKGKVDMELSVEWTEYFIKLSNFMTLSKTHNVQPFLKANSHWSSSSA